MLCHIFQLTPGPWILILGGSFHSSPFSKNSKNICVFHCRNAFTHAHFHGYFAYYTNDFTHASLVPPIITFWDSLNWQITPLGHKDKVAKNCLSGDRWRYLQCFALRPFPTKRTFLTFISFSNTFSTLYANLIMGGFINTFWFPFFLTVLC